MKNQYFGDINDYRKYSLVRTLSGLGHLNTAICWMLTNDDLNSDGERTKYLCDPHLWRQYDSDIFDFLQIQLLSIKRKEINSIENANVFSNVKFFSEILSDDSHQRKKYMEKLSSFSKNLDFIFFDPDNGLEIKSVAYGSKKSSKYLFYPEINHFYSCEQSILIYQHLPPKPHVPLSRTIVNHLKEATKTKHVYLYWTQFVLFVLLPQEKHTKLFESYNKILTNKWNKQFLIQRF
jgi:hypothetical protein